MQLGARKSLDANDQAGIARGYTPQELVAYAIANGAPDMFGQLPSAGDLEPQVVGLLAFPAGSTSSPYPRGTDPGVQPIEVPSGPVDVWFAFDDANTAALDLQVNQFKLSTASMGFDTIPAQNLAVGNGFVGPDFGNANVGFTHLAALDLSGSDVGTYYFLRVYVNDGDHTEDTEIPNDGTGPPMRDYFTLKVVP